MLNVLNKVYFYTKRFETYIAARSECVDPEQSHDYAEIYTPSREKPPWDCPKPPTPPLHRFPSWESRIYQVANEGLATSQATIEASPHQGQGYKEISVPVFATVKGVNISIFFLFLF